MLKSNKLQDLINNYSELDLEVLPDKLRKNGFDYELVVREPRKCVYMQCKGSIIAYEVFLTKISLYRDAMMRMKNKLGTKNKVDGLKEYREVFPGDEDFGKRAWTYPTLENAMLAYDGL